MVQHASTQVLPSVRPPKIIQKSSKIQFAFNGVGPIFCAVKATILGHILAPFWVNLVGFYGCLRRFFWSSWASRKSSKCRLHCPFGEPQYFDCPNHYFVANMRRESFRPPKIVQKSSKNSLLLIRWAPSFVP